MRRGFHALLALLVWLAAGSTGMAAESERPNILFITSDDHRWDALGAAGNPAVHTPALDRLAAESIFFRQATVHVSQCLPSRATLLTGLPAHQHGVFAHEHQSPGRAKQDAFHGLLTLPGLLRQAGYDTALVGKWHLETDPWESGFSQVKTWIPGGGADYQDPVLARGRSRAEVRLRGNTQEILANDAVEFLHARQAKRRPFLLWLAFTAPHMPLEPNPPYIQKLYAGKKSADLLPPGFPKGVPTNDFLHYYEAVSSLDEQVGRVMSALEVAGLAESTVVVFLGDNGHMMGQRGIGATGVAGKVVPYEGSVRVPLMIRSPRMKWRAGASDLPGSSLDVPPTLLTLAGLSVPASWPGRDLLSAKIEESFSEWADETSERWGRMAYRSVRTARHKLIVWKDPQKKPELYDLAADPGEEKNLIDTPEAQTIRKDLEARLRAWMETTADPAAGWATRSAAPRVPAS
ncbi:MAG TPA: sulfatase-like hydrolase/transferase [Thermoanaerobaculia bacterium]